ncbi:MULTISPECIES: hypothetical protein [unclassified Nocardiopsis]|uniref:hypothetical protein n=1 Tax=unclassified Nocardiopsis TaxID=2649073 RepID=UPI0033E6B62A
MSATSSAEIPAVARVRLAVGFGGVPPALFAVPPAAAPFGCFSFAATRFGAASLAAAVFAVPAFGAALFAAGALACVLLDSVPFACDPLVAAFLGAFGG